MLKVYYTETPKTSEPGDTSPDSLELIGELLYNINGYDIVPMICNIRKFR